MLISLVIWPHQPLRAEGTRQVTPSADDQVLLLTGRDDFSNFAEFDGPADSRLYISVSDDPNETIFIGLSGEYDDNGLLINRRPAGRYKFRIKNEAGVVVHGPFSIDYTNANISSWEQARFGAYSTSYNALNPATGRVDPVFRFQPGQAGNYYIEFDDDGNDGNEKVLIGFWDFTVASGNQEIPGRVWSRNWAFRTPPNLKDLSEEECKWNRKFNGELFSYTTDGFVSKIDFQNSGFQGLAFTVAFNSTGPGTSGNLEEDRRSRPEINLTGNSAEHRIFLHNPDEALFPSGDRGSAFVDPVFKLKEDSFCLDVIATRPGQVEVILDFNRNGRFDPETDVSLIHCFDEQDFPDLPNGVDPCDTTSTSTATAEICWDGIKGDGSSATTCGDTVNLVVVYTQGVQHWAVYDGEFMKNGFCVEVVRPVCPDDSRILTDQLYWDDRLIDDDAGTGQPKVNLDGCKCREEGCRTWDNFSTNQACDDSLDDKITTGYGDKNTLNTWWFANVTRQVTANIPILSCEITGRDTICEGESTEFFVDDAPNKTYSWIGPDGSVISTGHSTGPIDQPGTYAVTITDERDCQKICSQELVVLPPPTLSLESKQNVSCRAANDGAITLGASGGAGDYRYSLDGVNFQTDSIFTGLAPGIYTAVLQDAAGCTDTLEVSIGIDPLPVLNYPDTLVICTGESAEPPISADPELDYQWTPANGLDDPSVAAPVFSPEMTTTYIVTAAKKTNSECFVMDTMVVVVQPLPTLDIFTDTTVFCDGQASLTAITDPSAEIRWLDTDGNVLATGPELSIPLDGDREVIAEATGDNGCQSIRRTLLIDSSIDVDVPDLISACLGDDLTIDVVNNKPEDALTYQWTPADAFEPGTADGPNPVLTQEEGERRVYVTISNEDGCVFRDSVQVIVIDPDFNLDFSYEVECNGATVQFTNLSTGAFAFEWDFGDPNNPGAGSTEVNPTYTYTEAGTYQVRLSLRYDVPCSDITSITKEVVVTDPRIIADFDFELIDCAPGSAVIAFTDASSSATEAIVAWDWVFSNGAASSDQNPQITITESGPLGVQLTITTENDCQASVRDTLNFILPSLELRDTALCPGESVILNPGGDPNLEYEWMPAEGLSDPTAASPVAMPGQTTTYTVTARGIGSDTCALSRQVTVQVEAPLNLAVSDDQTSCGEDVTLTATTDGDATFEWRNEQGTVIGREASIVVNPEREATYYVTATSPAGCAETDSVTVTDQGIEVIVFTGDVTGCGPQEVAVEVANQRPEDILIYEWDPDSLVSDPELPNPIIRVEEGSVTFTLRIENQFGCVDTIEAFTITALPEPQPNLPDTVIVCSDVATDKELAPMADPTYQYEWSPATGLDRTDVPNPKFSGSESVTYTVTVTDITGTDTCSVIKIVDVIVPPPINLTTTPDTILCMPSVLTLTAESPAGNVTFTWFDAFSLEDTIGTGPEITVMPPVGTTTYNVLAQDEAGCTQQGIINVTVSSLDEEALPNPQVLACGGTPTPLNPNGNPGFIYQWDPLTGLDTTESWNPIVTVDTDITYGVTVTDPLTGCFLEGEVSVDVDPPINLIVSPDTILCEPGTVTLNAQTGLAEAVIRWFDNSAFDGPPLAEGNNYSFKPASPGTTTIYVKAEIGSGCFETDSVKVTLVDLSGDSNLPDTTLIVCEGTSFPLFLNEDYNYTWSPTTGLDLSDPSRPVVTANEDITYSVTIEDPVSGCSITDTLELDVIPSPMLIVSDDTTICEPAEVRLIAMIEGDAPLEWSLNPDFSGDPLSTMDTIFVTPEETTTYYVRALIDTVLCPVMDSVTVELAVPPVPEGFPDSTLVACKGDSIQLELPADLDYQWSPEESLDLSDPANPILIADMDRVYDVTITDPQSGCDVVIQVRTKVRSRDTLQISAMDVTLCELQETTLTATTVLPATFKWYDNPELTGEPLMGSTVTVMPSAGTTTYFVVAMSDDPCVEPDTAEVVVTVQDLPGTSGLSLEPVPACQGDTVMFTLNPAYAYEWSPSVGLDLTDPFNPKIKALNSITYTVTITDETTGCEAVVEVMIEVSPNVQLMVSPVDTTLCEPEEVTFAADAGAPAVISWYADAGLTNPILVDSDTLAFEPPVGTTTIYVLAEGTGGCNKNDTAVVRVFVLDPFEGIDFPEGPIQACPGETATLVLPEGFEYSWSPLDGIDISNPLEPVFTITGARTYTLTITDPETGCTKELIYEAQPFPVPMPVINRDIITRLCEAGAVQVEASTSIPSTIEWFDNPAFEPPSLGQGNVIPVDILADSTWIYAVATSTNGCVGVDSILFTIIDLFDESGLDTMLRYCPGESRMLNLNPAFTYQWTPDDAGIDLTDPANPVFTGDADRSYMVTITDGESGCLDTATVNVRVNPDLGLVAAEDSTVCRADEIELSGMTNVPATIEWTSSDPGFGTVSGPSISVIPPAGTTFYYVKATDTTALACMATDTVRIDFFPIDATLNDAISCEPADELELTVVNNDENQELTYMWFPPEAILSDPFSGPGVIVDPNVATEYSVDLVNQFGCDTTLTATAKVIILGDSLSITPDTTILEGEEIQLEVDGCIDCMYDWSPKDGTLDATDVPDPVAMPVQTTTYTVIVEKQGCLDTLDVIIGVEDFICGFPNVYLPNAFTPNGDGVNDVLFVRGRNITRVHLIIFNRWGQKVFETNDQEIGWDGTFEGEELPPDVYGYYLEVQCGDGETYIAKGNVTLLR